MKKINIAIDGLAGSGKSSVAKLVAKKLNYTYVDTGSMYRCVALLMVRNNIAYDDNEKIMNLLNNYFSYHKDKDSIYLNGEDVTYKIRTFEVNNTLPFIVSNKTIRSFLVNKQKEIGRNKGIIMDGRDIGSVVLPDAELKIYQVADLNERALRRHKENLEKGIDSDYDMVLENLKQRDYVDINISKALVKTSDAIEIDTTNMEIDEVVSCIIELVEKKVKEC